MKRRLENVIWGLTLGTAMTGMACSGASPVSPSSSGTTIRGTTVVVGATSGTRSGSMLDAAAPATLRVCVSGTRICADVSPSGTFELSGDFEGDVTLQVTTSQGNVTLRIDDVRRGETIVVTVVLNGLTGTIQVQSREGGGQGEDDESEDDESDDDESDDDEDDDSDDDESDDESDDDKSGRRS